MTFRLDVNIYFNNKLLIWREKQTQAGEKGQTGPSRKGDQSMAHDGLNGVISNNYTESTELEKYVYTEMAIIHGKLTKEMMLCASLMYSSTQIYS